MNIEELLKDLLFLATLVLVFVIAATFHLLVLGDLVLGVLGLPVGVACKDAVFLVALPIMVKSSIVAVNDGCDFTDICALLSCLAYVLVVFCA